MVERGVHITPGGHTIEADRRTFQAGQFKISPPYLFESHAMVNGAVVMAQLQSLDEGHDEFLHVRIHSVKQNGFQFCMFQVSLIVDTSSRVKKNTRIDVFTLSFI